MFTWLKTGSVTRAKGFLAAGLASGIKKNGKMDSCLIYSSVPCVSAGAFTANQAKAWPVQYSIKAIRHRAHRAILANSGNANCFNGPGGLRVVSESVAALSRALRISKREVLVCSTGVIGRTFPKEKFLAGIPPMVRALSRAGDAEAAQGILTTDKLTKELALEFRLGGRKVRLGGIAKGAGMVHPHMATMLCFITTDLAIRKAMLETALKEAVTKTFNRLAIDNDMSTNDTVLALANGEAKNKLIQDSGQDYKKFVRILTAFTREMALKLAEDGEGVTRVCSIRVERARDEAEAEALARHVANSMLVKTMFAGGDPNWGRVVAALGAAGPAIDWRRTEIYFDSQRVFSRGRGKAAGLSLVRKVLAKKHFTLKIVLHQGRANVSFLTSDLTAKYVRINASYTS